jgi:HD superfamily phosphohydrolase YqeK
MASLIQRTWDRLTRLITRRRTRKRAPAVTELPAWAEAGRKRRAHIRRMAVMLNDWADIMGVSAAERSRWLAACWLHDALRDADLPAGVSHGAAAADRAAADGHSDSGVLSAVHFHSVGYAGWDDCGKMLFLADFLEPGRKSRRKQRAQMARRVPRDRDGVLREIVGQQIRSRLRRERPVDPLTLEFWNSLVRTRDYE